MVKSCVILHEKIVNSLFHNILQIDNKMIDLTHYLISNDTHEHINDC